ncbi:hypothetical protein CEXT_180171 [Caerostris extrusa]|uniref:Transmembrane protein n=1 Tax=Caerostris extrusa TaxID=172846 RepID=A0AAV4RNM9_CAEEX|nr:hypothetical protein CEXT_180171 [Caerostris extrusa]
MDASALSIQVRLWFGIAVEHRWARCLLCFFILGNCLSFASALVIKFKFKFQCGWMHLLCLFKYVYGLVLLLNIGGLVCLLCFFILMNFSGNCLSFASALVIKFKFKFQCGWMPSALSFQVRLWFGIVVEHRWARVSFMLFHPRGILVVTVFLLQVP